MYVHGVYQMELYVICSWRPESINNVILHFGLLDQILSFGKTVVRRSASVRKLGLLQTHICMSYTV